MTILEEQFMQTVPRQLRAIREALIGGGVGLVKVTQYAYINPREVSSLCQLPTDMADNKGGGRVNITMKNEMTFETFFKTAEEAVKALGMKIA